MGIIVWWELGLRLGPSPQGHFQLLADIYKLNIMENMCLIFSKWHTLLAHIEAVF